MFPLLPLLSALLHAAPLARAQVTAAGPNGPTNPDTPSFLPVGSTVNQTSDSRLISLNGVDDFCIYGPPEAGPDSLIGNVEPIVVAYCTKPRNGARLIPDGTITAAHFIKTDMYVQIHGFWDGTKINIPAGDAGGELDPHGAENKGNPVGGNATSNVSGKDVFYEEWMSFVSYDQFCLRICTNQTNNVSAALQCEHELDIMGCQFVMAIDNFYQSNNSFSSCEGEPAAPPGLYPSGSSTSTFRQRYTGTYTNEGTVGYWTVGQTVTPSAPAFFPSTSSCSSYSTISNGINTANFAVTATPTPLTGGSTSSLSAVLGSGSAATGSSGAATSRSSGTGATSSRSGTGSSAGPAQTNGAAASPSSGATKGAPAGAGTAGWAMAGAVAVVGGLVGAVLV